MTRPAPKATSRRFRNRWAVALYVVIAVAVCTAIMLWQLSNDSLDEPDSAPAARSVQVDAGSFSAP